MKDKEYEITVEDVKKAYLSLKSSFYYENNVLLYLKMQIAHFEYHNIFNKSDFFKEFAEKINKNNIFDEFIQKINYKKVIKKMEYESREEKILKLIRKCENSKELKKENIELINTILASEDDEEKIIYNYIIDCPIELHLLSVLWIMKEGIKLDKSVSKYSYGYRLNLDEKDNLKERYIFKKYIMQYKDWKNKGIKKAKEIISEEENAVLVNLDLKRFYYNINHDILKEKIKRLDPNILSSPLTNIIMKINQKYGELVSQDINKNDKYLEYDSNAIIPIGLYSSSILANIYLKDLDDEILKLRPDYYGRYVDDIFLVFKEYKKEEFKSKSQYLKNKLSEIIEIEKIKKLGIEKSFNKDILLENEKQNAVFLDRERGKADILKIENSFLERASTFAFLPNEKDIEKLYEQISMQDHEEEKSKKHDVAIYLSKILNIFSGVNKQESLISIKETAKELLDFFSEENLIKYYVYYDKIFTFFIMNDLVTETEKFYQKTKIYFQNRETDQKTLDYLNEYLILSMIFSISLKPVILKKINISLKKEIWKYLYGQQGWKDLIPEIIQSNIFKQNLINYPLLNYSEINNWRDKNFLDINYFNDESLKLCEEKLRLSPRFIHLDEFNLFHVIQNIFDNEKNYIDESKKNFSFNFIKNNTSNNFNNNIQNYESEKIDFFKINSSKEDLLAEIKIGIASMLIDEKKIFDALYNNQDLSLQKKSRINEILNLAKKNKINILIFPEIMVPLKFLNILNLFSRKNQILITGGLEYVVNRNEKKVYNYLFTILPFISKKYTTSVIKTRLKNYYSPLEKIELEGRYFQIPCLKKRYDIFSWKGIHFSNFNCFELTDIEGRSSLKNYIDLLISSVYNKDIYYFRNILESTCRDLHVFIAQSNTSKYGDCEIIQPTKRETMTIASIKGGINDHLLIGVVNVNDIRNFQLTTHEKQIFSEEFKLTPPGINPDIVQARKENLLEKYIKFQNKEKK
ncbi:RNA-directed DNA polymerase [Fusobacterium necrophorum]|uniref:RNA-directed DNA polymerase n=1 Tax=Fusobacterium necrophorum TaxID=859 RepID=UPI003FA161D8